MRVVRVTFGPGGKPYDYFVPEGLPDPRVGDVVTVEGREGWTAVTVIELDPADHRARAFIRSLGGNREQETHT